VINQPRTLSDPSELQELVTLRFTDTSKAVVWWKRMLSCRRPQPTRKN